MLKSLAVVAVAVLASVPAVQAQKAEPLQRSEVPGEIVVCFASTAAPVDLNQKVQEWNLPGGNGAKAPQMILRWQEPGNDHHTNMALLSVGARADTAALIRQLQATPGVKWAEPNVMLTGDPREVVPNDPDYPSQYHHAKMQNNLAWDTTMGSASVIVAMTDDGIDMTHPDLTPNFWINSDEIAGNLVDDDGNGFVDDINGWDFISNDNSPAHTGSDSHGTHTSGIVGARTNNSVGVAGTAGATSLMPIRFYSGAAGWTATGVAAAFNYATNNGAKIISTSYNIDGWVGNATVTTAFQFLYDNGVLHFNSAGNNNQLNPPRQAFHQTLLVASTDSADVRSSFSNYGTGIDVAAPGSSILSTLPVGTYGLNSGTSMATPNAAGVAALIWAAHPTWTRDQVAANVCGLADNIHTQNPSYVNLLGGGRVNSFQGVTGTLPAPRMLTVGNLPAADGGSVMSMSGGFRLRFNQVMSPVAVNTPGVFSMLYAGADGGFGTPDDAPVVITWPTYLIGTNEIQFTVTGGASLTCGRYRVTASGAILENPFGTNLDGNANGSGGDSWTRTFNLEPCAGDVNCSGAVDVTDLLAVINAWGNSPGGRADITGDGTVNVSDLLAVINAWGICVPPGIAGDHCDFPIIVSTGAVAFSTVGATTAGPAPVTCVNNFGNDIWYRFTPAASGTATVHTCAGATFDSYLLAYSGTCGSLTQIACNDDSTMCATGNRSRMTVPVTAGTPVLIRLGGYGSATGTGTLTISIP